jgi:hypothetical protein
MNTQRMRARDLEALVMLGTANSASTGLERAERPSRMLTLTERAPIRWITIYGGVALVHIAALKYICLPMWH